MGSDENGLDTADDNGAAEQEAQANWRRTATAVRAGQAGFAELAAAFAQIDHVFAFVPPGEFARFMEDLTAARDEKGFGNVNVSDAATPRVHGVETESGFAPSIFLDSDFAREFAVTNGYIQPADNAPFTSKSPAAWLWDVMNEGHAGAVFDEGAEHELRIDRGGCSRLFALLNLEQYAQHETVWLLQAQGRLALMRDRSQDTTRATIFSEQQAADLAVQHSTLPECSSQATPLVDALRTILAAGCTHVVVDEGFRTQFVYERDDLVRMLQLLGEPEPEAAPLDAVQGSPHAEIGSTASAAVDEDPGDDPAELEAAIQFPSFAPVAPPDRPDAKSFEAFRALAAKSAGATQGSVHIWEFVDQLAFDLDLYVPRHGARVDGLVWPSFFRHPREEDQTVAYAFSREAVANTRSAADEMGDTILHLSGLEAMRWAWAAPKAIDEIMIDAFPGSVGSLGFPTNWVLSAIWPHFFDVERLDDVAQVNLGRLGRQPGARGTQPEVVRALVRGWQGLVPAKTVSETRGIPQADGTFIPVFSSAESYFSFDQANPDLIAPAPRFERAPFSDWLNSCAGVDGVVLDPGGPWPIKLDATDLLVLHRWESERRRPDGADLSFEVAQRLADGSFTDRVAGRVLADWPRYFVCLQRNPDGNVCVMTLPDRDCGAIFSTQARADLYLEVYRQAGLIDGTWEPVPVLSKWRHSIFRSLAESYEEGGWIDPSPPEAGMSVWANNFLGNENFDLDPTLVMDGHPGVHVFGERLEAALERLDQKLKPRVPDFVPAGQRTAA